MSASGRTDDRNLNAATALPSTRPEDDAAHILVVDDDRRLRALLSSYLRRHGHRVTVAASARQARQVLAGLEFDILVLDVMMPGESGFDFAADLRRDSQVPVLMLTARAEAADRVRGLETGVDDYLTKPFEPRELLLRIGSILRRARAAPIGRPDAAVARFGPFTFSLERGELRQGEEVVRITDREREMLRLLALPKLAAPIGRPDAAVARFGPFTFSLERGELRQGEEVVRITDREREMLRLLCANAGESVSREALSGSGAAAQERTVDVLVNRLRRKIERDPANPVYLQTARGSGYRLVVDG